MTNNYPEYDFPCRLFDFETESEISFTNYRDLENHLRMLLFSPQLQKVKDGLSNVLYWGFYRIGYGKIRLKSFRDNISKSQLETFSDLIRSDRFDAINIKKIGMPQFSGFSFVSKILMFSNPLKYVVLDKKIMELRDSNNLENPLSNIPYTKNDSGIRITQKSQKYYLKWCNLCIFIASQNTSEKIAADIERELFKMVETNRISEGRQIISSQIKKLHVLKTS